MSLKIIYGNDIRYFLALATLEHPYFLAHYNTFTFLL